jgi:hypothetical protein
MLMGRFQPTWTHLCWSVVRTCCMVTLLQNCGLIAISRGDEPSLRTSIQPVETIKGKAIAEPELILKLRKEILSLRSELEEVRRKAELLTAALWEQAGAEFGWIKIDRAGGSPHWEPLADHSEIHSLPGSPFSRTKPEEGLYGAVRFKTFRPGALSKLPGKELCIRLYLDTCGVKDKDLQEVGQLNNLQWLTLYRSEISDAGLKHLAGLKKLNRLGLHDSNVGDEGMKIVANFTGLEVLGIGKTNVTDIGLAELAALKQLWLLDIAETAITDASIVTLLGMKKMRMLYMSSAISQEGRDQLQKAIHGQ